MAAKDKSEEIVTPEVTEETAAPLAVATEVPMGFENEEAGDMIIPRVKVVQTLSPERKDGTASEGDIINSLTLEKLNGKVFVPVFKFNNHILWRDRSEGGGMLCMARDGKHGIESDGNPLICAVCRKCEFDNTKQGKDAQPSCTKYINFFGFIEGERLPMILSFSKTNYNEGKKLYSIAKVTMQNMFNHGYTITEKLQAKSGNEWFIIQMSPAGPTSDADRAFAVEMYKSYVNTLNTMRFDVEDTSASTSSVPSADVDASEY